MTATTRAAPTTARPPRVGGARDGRHDRAAGDARRRLRGRGHDSRAVAPGPAVLRAARASASTGSTSRRRRRRRARPASSWSRGARRPGGLRRRRDHRGRRSAARAGRRWRAPRAPRSAAASSASPDRTARPRPRSCARRRCGRWARCCAPPGNLNTDVGLPLTILSAAGNEAAWVLEMAMRGRGEIAYLAEIARPHIGVITNVGARAPRDACGSIEEIARAKGELFAAAWRPGRLGGACRRRSADRGAGRARAPPTGG